jgi:hypothetical protein
LQAGYVKFARLLGDQGGPDVQALLRDMNIVEVPSFLFFRCALGLCGGVWWWYTVLFLNCTRNT